MRAYQSIADPLFQRPPERHRVPQHNHRRVTLYEVFRVQAGPRPGLQRPGLHQRLGQLPVYHRANPTQAVTLPEPVMLPSTLR